MEHKNVQGKEKRRPKHLIFELEERIALISSAVEAERRRNTQARLEARLLEALLLSRLVLTCLLDGGAASHELHRAADQQDVVAGDGGGGGGDGDASACPAATAAGTVAAGSKRHAGSSWRSGGGGTAAATEEAAVSGSSERPVPHPPPLLARLQSTLDALTDDLHGTYTEGASAPAPALLPLAHRLRISRMFASMLSVRERQCSGVGELYVWWLRQMGEARAALSAAGAAAPPADRDSGGRDERTCGGPGGASAVDARLAELLHAATSGMMGHALFQPWTFELVTSNMETRQVEAAGEELWAAWVQGMGLSEQQESLLLGLYRLYESHTSHLRSEQRRLLATITAHPPPDIIELSDTVEALAAVNSWIPICEISTNLVVLGAVVTPRQALQLCTAAAPRWLPHITGLLETVTRQAEQRERQQPQAQAQRQPAAAHQLR